MNNYKVGICGFRNIGNTCYMNSILQLLLHCKPLLLFVIKKNDIVEYEKFLRQASINYIAAYKRKKYNIDDDTVVSIQKSEIEQFMNISVISKYAEIVDAITTNGLAVITPVSFKKSIDTKINNFRQFIHHDAHEFLIHVLDLIIEETGIECEPILNNVPTQINEFMICIENSIKNINEETDDENKKRLIDELNEFKKNNDIVLKKYNGLKYMMNVFKEKYSPFNHQLQTIIINYIECTSCNYISTNYENTTVLQLDVYDTLENSFSKMNEIEIIENSYTCSMCKEKKSVKKYCKLWRTPCTMFIQLKRFKHLPDGRIMKNNTAMVIPELLDISSYCEDNMSTDKKVKYVYRLRGFSNHMGSLNGGHYTADCRNIIDDESWYHFDDSRVSKYNDNNINKNNAYVLLYELV